MHYRMLIDAAPICLLETQVPENIPDLLKAFCCSLCLQPKHCTVGVTLVLLTMNGL